MNEAERGLAKVVAQPAPRADLTDEAKLAGQLEARLPKGVFRRLMSRVEDITHPSERVAYLTRAANIVDAYKGIVEGAERIIRTEPRRAEVHANGTMHLDVPVRWTVLTHIALSAGWVRIGYGRLERNAAGRDTASPSPAEVPKEETHPSDSTATPDKGKVELIVAYEADGAQFMPRIRGEELLEFRLGGQVMAPPGPTLDGIYRWLGTHGYVPASEQFKWLDRHEGRRRRRQVYVYQPRERAPERRLTHAQAWDAARGYRLADL